MTDLELMNLKNASLLTFKEIRRKIIKAKKEVGGGKKRVSEESVITTSVVGDYKWT